MSFAADLKLELSKIRQDSCCDFAELFSMLIFSKKFNIKSMVVSSSHECVCNTFSRLLFNCFSAKPVVTFGGSDNKRYYNASIISEKLKKSILFKIGENHKEFAIDLLKRDCCSSAFLRGIFLICGSISNPNKDYHLEFVVKDSETADFLVSILSNYGVTPKLSYRKNSVAVYFKNSDQIEELITRMGASQYTLELIGIKVYKSMRNKYNRINNCENANLTKTVNAAVDQKNAIEFLEKSGKLSMLPTEIYNVAMLRKDNPDASLSSLCSLSEENISRSGMNHRLQKLVKIANALKEDL